MELQASSNAPNSTTDGLLTHKRINSEDGGCEALLSNENNVSNGDTPSPKRLKIDNTSTNATTILKDVCEAHKNVPETTNGEHRSQNDALVENNNGSNDPAPSDSSESESENEEDDDSVSGPKERIVNDPVLLINPTAAAAHLDVNPRERMPLFFTDIKELVAYSGVGDHASRPGSWWQLCCQNRVPQTVFLLIEGLSIDDFVTYRDCFPNLDEIFPSNFEVITPAAYDGSFVEELVLVPMTHSKQRGFLKNYSCLEGALLRHHSLYGYKTVKVDHSKFDNKPVQKLSRQPENYNYRCFLEVMKRRRHLMLEQEKKERMAKVGKKLPRQKLKRIIMVDNVVYQRKMSLSNLPPSDKFPRTQLIMSRKQHVSEGVPTPLGGDFSDRYADYVPTKDLYAPVTANSPMFAIDCEMVRTTAGDRILELARVSIVDEDMKCIYDELVKPENRVTNYLTTYSGITAKMLADVTKRLGDVHRDIRALLPMDAILVGHSIASDLNALRMMHPYLIDTSVIYNMHDNIRCKAKLALLSKLLLGQTIQDGHGHSPVEDGEACMKLVQLKLSKDIVFGDTMLESHTEALDTQLDKRVESTQWNQFPISSQRVGFMGNSELRSCQLVEAEKLSREIQKFDVKRSSLNDKKKRWIMDMTLADPLFGLLRFVGKSAVLVGTKDVIARHDEFRPEIRKKLAQFVNVVTTKDTKDVFEQVAKNLRYEFVVGHAYFDAKVVENAKDAERRMIFSAIDKACRKIWDGVTEHAMCTIVFGGRERGNNGLCFVRLNNENTELK